MKRTLSYIAVFATVCLAVFMMFPFDETLTNVYSKIQENDPSADVPISQENYWYNKLTDNEKKIYKSI
ncbi:MAG: hypothetical protein RSE39_07960, partial [Oscillospiraceae bacterium]